MKRKLMLRQHRSIVNKKEVNEVTLQPNEPNESFVFFEAKTSLTPIATVGLPKPIEVSPPQVEKSPTLING